MKIFKARGYLQWIIASLRTRSERHVVETDQKTRKWPTHMARLAACLLLATTSQGATLTVPDQYATIQAAVDAAGLEDEVFVRAGVYSENVRLSYSNPYLVLRGEDAETTVIDGSGDTCIEIVAAGHTGSGAISGFTLMNGPDTFGGSCLRLSGDESGSWAITDNIFRDTEECGIIVFNGEVELRDNLFLRCGSRGVFVSSDATVRVINNTFIATGSNGVYAHPQAAYAEVSGNIFAFCRSDYNLSNAANDSGCNLLWALTASAIGGAPTDFEAEPLFCDDLTDNYLLCADSPALPDNQPADATCGLIGAFGAGCAACDPQGHTTSSWGDMKTAYR